MRAMLLATTILAAIPAVAASTSVYPVAPDEPRAVTVRAKSDGRADATAAIQQALDAARDKTGHGIVFLPSGRYRLTRTIVVPPGVRVFGVGPTRPVLVLAPNTPGFQQGVSTLVVFGGGPQYGRPQPPLPVPTIVPRDKVVQDAHSSTFYSAMANIDVEIGAGNPAAAAVRFRMAQHAFLNHMDFQLGSAFAGVYQAGNIMKDVHFHGGRYGIVTEKTSPAWQFTLVDSSFDGQRDAAIREHEARLTLANVAFRNVPVGIEIDRGYSDSLWGKNVRFENVSRAGVVISNENQVFTQIGFDHAVASNTPVFARFRDSGKTVAGKGRTYEVASFSYGLHLPAQGRFGEYKTEAEIRAIPSLPAPVQAIRATPGMREWVNVKTLGVKGDWETDDTAAIQKAIDTHRVLYFPTGNYRVTNTLKLRPDTVLVGMHPAMTQLAIPEDNPNHAGLGTVVPIVESPRGGDNILNGIGLFTGRINPRASSLLWRSGANSLVEDVKIAGGGGTPTPDGKPLYNRSSRGGDPIIDDRLDGQYPSIWVTDGGGGTFADVWSPQNFASAGFYISNTATPGHIYEVSVEHHARNEFILDNVQNWEFLASQTEQEVADGPNAISLEIRNSKNILFANHHAYRVTRTYAPQKSAIKLFNSSDIRFHNLHSNAESGAPLCDGDVCGTYLRASKYAFGNAIEDVTNGIETREREFAKLHITGKEDAPRPAQLAGAGELRKVADGFWSISGATVAPDGTLYFIDRRFQRIHRWSEGRGLEVVRDHPLDPVNLAVDASGKLMVVSGQGRYSTVYSLDPNGPKDQYTVIQPTAVAQHAGAQTALPVNWWVNGEYRDTLNQATYQFPTMAEMFAEDATAPKANEYVSPDGSLVLPAFRVFQQGPIDRIGWRWSNALNTYGLIQAKQGERVFVANSTENMTYSATVGAGGALTDLKPFADRGGESVAVDGRGRVFVANGQVFVYDRDGREAGRIDVPERPLQLLFGGADGATLFILTHHGLYAARP
jgi:sugar lactone lactonase YvrE